MSRFQQLFDIGRACLTTVIELVLALEEEVRDLRRQVKELKDRLSLNSSNSSKPKSNVVLSLVAWSRPLFRWMLKHPLNMALVLKPRWSILISNISSPLNA